MICLFSRRTAAFVGALVFCVLVLPGLGRAQDAGGVEGADDPPLAVQLESRLATVAAELERVRAQLAAGGGQPAATLEQEEALLERVELLLQQHRNTLSQVEESRVALAQLTEELETLRRAGPAEPPPYSIVMLDAVRDELRTLRGRLETLEAGETAAAQTRERARATLDQSEIARRRAAEAAARNSEDAQAGDLANQLRLSELQSRVASEELQLRQIEHERQELLRQVFDARLALTTERERAFAADAGFAVADLRSRIADIEAQESQLRRELELQPSRVAFREREWLAAKQRLESDRTADPALAEEVAMQRLAFQVRQREAVVLAQRLDRLATRREMWERRFKIWQRTEDRATIATWDADARALLESLDTEYRIQDLELRDIASERASLQTRLDGVESDSPIAGWLRQELQLNTTLRELSDANTVSIESTRRLAERVLGDLGQELSKVSFGDRVRGVWRAAAGAWGFEVTSVDDRSITVGKIVIGLVLLLVGFSLSRLISNWLARRVFPRLGLNEGASAAIRSILFYLLLISFVFLALRTVNIPLTAFAILGGAIAIGVGFGSQAIMNNFMSGLILIAERPIRVGDLIQLGDLYGTVQLIGARSTRVLTGANVEIVVPNSAFLESNVINWTLSESRVRIHVSVGVAYGSPTRDVAKLLRVAVDEHGRVLKTPEPIVLFTEFGDNSLNFEVHFWIKMRKMMDRRKIESDIRHRIDSLFDEAGIVIAFPQRDVHLDSVRPLEVRVLPAGTGIGGAMAAGGPVGPAGDGEARG